MLLTTPFTRYNVFSLVAETGVNSSKLGRGWGQMELGGGACRSDEEHCVARI